MENSDFEERLNALFSKWEQDFTPLYLAITSTVTKMDERIFEEGRNTAGAQLPSPSYSTKEIYVDVNTLPNTPSAYQVGKRGTKIKSAYFPDGYKQLKQVVNRPVLELTNRLKSAFYNESFSSVSVNGFDGAISLPDSEKGKRMGLEAKYGTIFQMTQEETDLFTEVLQYEITESINKALQ